MSFVRIRGVLLHYRLNGPQIMPPLVLVNSLGTDLRIWDAVVAELSANYHVLTYDKRGHGLSDAPDGEYTLEDHLDDLEGLLDHLGLTKVSLAGVSVGGLIAQGMALRAPHRLRNLVLCNTAPHMGTPQLWHARIEAARSSGLAGLADAIMERWFSPGFRQHRPDELAGWRNLFCRSDVSGYAATCATLRDTDLTQAITSIDLPTLVVAGTDDGAAPVEQVRHCMAIPGARFEVLDGVGHLPSIEQPKILATLLRQFLKEASHD